MKKQSKHCCNAMEASVKNSEIPICYSPVFREYDLVLDFPVFQSLRFCPWCGKKLPTSLRKQFFDILEKEYQIEDGILEVFENKKLPKEFKSDDWWKKRKL